MSISSFVVPLPSDAPTPGKLPPGFDHARRRADLVRRLGDSRPDHQVVLICDTQDITYLSGVREGVSWLAIWDGGCFAVTRHMLIREVEQEIGDCELLLPTKRSSDPAMVELFLVTQLKCRGFESVVVDPNRISAASYFELEKFIHTAGLDLVPMPRLVDPLRQRKDPLELHLITRCVMIAERAFSGLIEAGAAGLVGRSELEIARELEARMLELGADRQGFPDSGIIVASGPNSASAHHSPGERPVGNGEPLLIDWGAEVSGYRSDMTRTLFLGSIPEFAKRAYQTVESALEAAAAVLRTGAKMGDVDRAARRAVTAAGYQEFHYGVGHGIGLAIHEGPWLRAHSEELLEPGMITTVEPGVYLPDIGGIRIESIYALSERATDRIDRLPVAMDQMILD